MGLYDTQTKFVQDGAEYEHANLKPEMAPGSVRRFTYGCEPHIIAQVPLAGGGTVEVHGYATHYNQEWVSVEWLDETHAHLACWVQAADVRRPGEREWRGKYVPFG